MKKILILTLALILSITLNSCKNKTQQKTVTKAKAAKELSYVINTDSTSVKWTAFKTTSKIPVSGTFKTLNITNTTAAKSIIGSLNNVKFSIPVSSIFSNNEARDIKLVKFFFNIMKNTTTLNGIIHTGENNAGSIELTMNGITSTIPVIFSTDGMKVSLKGTMDLDNWQAKLAIDALNKACNEKHKGKDGISKTWSEVTIESSTLVSKK